MDEALSVDDVLDSPLPPGVQRHEVISAAVLVEYIDQNGLIQVGWARSENVGIHRHIGVVMCALDDWRRDLQEDRSDV
jgi:hypothetical protein